MSTVSQVPSARWRPCLPRIRRGWSLPRSGVLVRAPVKREDTWTDVYVHVHCSLSMWYPRSMYQFRVGLFFGAASMAGAFSGLLAYGISFLSGTDGLLGWSWIFVGLLLPSRIMSITGCLQTDSRGYRDSGRGHHCFLRHGRLPKYGKVSHAGGEGLRYLEEECVLALHSGRAHELIFVTEYDNSSVGEEEHFSTRHIVAALTDWQVWLHILVYMSIVGPRA